MPSDTVTAPAADVPTASSGPVPAVDELVHRHLLDTDDLLPGDLDDSALTRTVRRVAPLLDAPALAEATRQVRARMGGVGRLDRLLADPDISDILINGPGPVWTERRGRLTPTGVVVDEADIALLIEKSLGPLGLRADRAEPIVDARLPDGSRLHVVLPPVAVDGPYVTIRRFAARTIPLGTFCSPAVVDLLDEALGNGLNLLVTGGTGAGKTTFLNSLCQRLPPGERVVTVEDSAELRLPGDHVVRLETRPATPDGVPSRTMRDLVRAALRMRPSRLVVGETRGSEALDFLQALNTGHDGSLSTCHANGPADGLRRLESLASMATDALPLDALRDQLASSLDLIVHVARGTDGSRRVTEVAEVSSNPRALRRVGRLVVDDMIVSTRRRPARRTEGRA